jgi:formate hydrogenlyase subunit 6/NADH:ubiquinone oxidoreductase subunit I
MTTETYRNLLRKRATILYPFKEREKVTLPERLRGKIEFYREKCIGCTMCFVDCPSGTIEMIEDEKGKRPVFYLDRCTYCAQCEEICPTGAIKLTKNYEIITFHRKDMFVS